MKNIRNVWVALLSVCIVSQYPLSMTHATSGAADNAVTNSLGSILLSSKVQVSLEDVNIWPQAAGNILTYTLNFSNSGSSSSSLMNYFSKVATPGGSLIMGHPISGDDLKKSVQPKDNIRVTYYVNLKQVSSLKGLKIPVYVWDANAKGYLKHAGTFTLPANDSTVTANGKSLNTTLNNIPVTASSESLELYPFNGKVYAKVGFSLTNRGKKVLEDPGYMAYLVSGGGSIFKLALSTQTAYQVQPGEKKTLYYVCELPANLNTANMKLQFTQKDETLNLEYATSAYKLPKAVVPNQVVGYGQVQKIMINHNSIETSLQNASVLGENGKGKWSFQLRVKNTGNKTVTFPAYSLAVKSIKGKSFPVESNGLSGITLKPLEEKVIPLSVQIPLEVEQNTLKLEMIEAAEQKEKDKDADVKGSVGITDSGVNIKLPVAYFVIPYIPYTDAQMGMPYLATNSFGSFSYSLESLQRLPWKEEDIVSAKLKITNTQSTNLSLPELKGSLKADLQDLSETTQVLVDHEAAVLRPGESTRINVLAHIPYTQEFRKLKIDLYTLEKDEKKAFLSLSTQGAITEIEPIKQGESYVISGQGKNANVTETNTGVYSGMNANIVATEMLLSSDEKRQTRMPRLQAYYKTGDGKLYDATANQPDTPASPGVNQRITFWAKLPKSVDTSGLKLVLGQGITGNKLSETGEEPSGYVNPVSMKLHPVDIQPKTNLSQIPLAPYTLSVLNSKGLFITGGNSIQINMNYNLNLKDNAEAEAGGLNHKLVLKMTDSYGQSQEKTLSIGTDLTPGNHHSYSVSFSFSQQKRQSGESYLLTLYDEIAGERIELGSERYPLFIEDPTESDR
ncbi:hypothetical protein MUG84_18365 [Paenibacillus sp. KQZ6P-2]|uniref:Uncharacterized protein n=1 Tax=Paenibacillus mangrovi TaxID=2931978 RepID=A0A9X1WU84_9BACL|nr:hypothetical protein [Paenibacillus mangrovi]MCJ8013693.1 hypothetical protein [Paenibacillus mangrovi]